MKKMSLYQLVCLLLIFLSVSAHATINPPEKSDATSLEGRWDMVIAKDGKELPSWLEVMHSGTSTLVGRFVYAFGSARPVAKVNFADGKFSFAIPPQWEPGTANMEFEGTLSGDKILGTMVYTDGKKYSWTGVRAPKLNSTAKPVWGNPIKLFNAIDMKGWHALGDNQWIVKNGVLQSPKSGSNLVSDQSFSDFKLHIEFRYPKGSNSGVYLRGRYEVQIVDSKGMEPWPDQFSAIYGFLPPNEMVAKDPGEWNSYDITLIGRMVTVVANGKSVITNQIIPGITGGALNSKEEDPGPIFIQGDHGPIEFRNIVITPAK